MTVIITDLEKALASLNEIMADHARFKDSGSVALGLRDGAIQRFEYTYELAWKTMKRALEDANEPPAATRRDLFRQAWEAGLIDDPQAWQVFHEARNDTSHAYRAEYADRVFQAVPAFAEACGALVEKLRERRVP